MRCAGSPYDLDLASNIPSPASLTLALRRIPFSRPAPDRSTLPFRLRAIRRRRLASKVSIVSVASAWCGAVALIYMIGGGLLNTR